MSPKPGTRVGAIFGKGPDGAVEHFGLGTYVGNEVPLGAVGMIAEVAIEMNRPNPRIDLDAGGTVWGCECWWCSEKEFSEILAKNPTARLVRIDEVRSRYREGAPS